MSVILDGVSFAAMGLDVFELSGWLDGPTVARNATGIPGLFGALPSPTATGNTRQITVGFRRKLDDITDRPDALALIQEALQGERRLSFADRPSVVTRAHCTALAVEGRVPKASMYWPTIVLRATFTAYDGVSYDIEPRTLVIGAVPTPVVIGSAPSLGLWYVQGALSAGTTRTITVMGINGTTYGTMNVRPPLAGEVGVGSLAETLGANDHLELDGMQRTVTKVTSAGVRSSVEHWFSGAWCAIDPKYAARAFAAFPRAAISSGAALLVYRRAWRL